MATTNPDRREPRRSVTTIAVYDDTRGRGVCRSCGAPVTWVQAVKSGKRIPFDGDVVYVRSCHDAARRLVGEIDPTVSPSHFATCPQANAWRRR